MVNTRSHCRNYFVLLALMLLLPTVAAFAIGGQFTVNVFGSDGATPVDGADVYVWDKNDIQSYANSGWMKKGTTATNGQVVITLDDIYMTANSITDPLPNIGFLVVPPRDPANSDLTFKTAEVVFYPLPGGSDPAIMPNPVDFTLEPGVKIGFSPTKGTEESNVPGLINNANVSIPNVPGGIEAHYVITQDDVLSNNNKWEVYWPQNTPFYGNIAGDGNYWNVSQQNYYPYQSFNFNVADVDVEFSYLHEQQKKGEVQFKVLGTNGLVDPNNQITVRYRLNYSDYSVNTTNGETSFYLPFGTYDFRLEPLTNPTDAISLRPQTIVGPEKVVVDYAPTSGVLVNCNVYLGDVSENDVAGNVDFGLANHYVRAEKKISFGAYDGWYEYQTAYGFLGYDDSSLGYNHKAVFNFAQKFEPGVYRFYVYSTSRSLIDKSVEPFKCYVYANGGEVEISSTNDTPELVMPQAPAFFGTVGVSNAPDQFSALNQPPLIAVVKDGNPPYGYQATVDYNDGTGKVFVPFLAPNEKLVIRADIPADITNDIPEAVKVFPPFQIGENGTTEITAPFIVTPDDFVMVSGDVLYNGQPYQDSLGVLNVNPLVTFGPGVEVPVSQLNIGQPAMARAFASDPGFSFRLQKGAAYQFNMNLENPSLVQDLEGFVAYNERYVVPDTGAANKEIVLQKGGSFIGKLQLNGGDLPPNQDSPSEFVQVGIEVKPKFDGDWNNFYNVGPRRGFTSPDIAGEFRVSGLTTGKYLLNINIDNVETDPNRTTAFFDNYTQQTMPLITREVVVDANVTTPPTLTFNLDDTTLRYVSGQVQDINNDPIAGLWLQVCRKTEWGDKGDYVFFTKTDSTGSFSITLEFGEYVVFAVGIDQMPTGYNYNLNLNNGYAGNYGSKIGELNIDPYSPETVSFNPQPVDINYQVAGNMTIDGEVINGYQHIFFFNAALENEGYGNVQVENNESKYSASLKPGSHFVTMPIVDWTAGFVKLYASSIDTGNQSATELDVDFAEADLKETLVTCKDDKGNPIESPYLTLLLMGDPTLGYAGQHLYVSEVSANKEGLCKLYLPDLPSELASYSYVLVVSNYWKSEPIIGPDGNPTGKSIEKIYTPTQSFVVIQPGTEQIDLIWKAPAEVVIKPAVVPAGAQRYIGVLMPKPTFDAGSDAMINMPQAVAVPTTPVMPASIRANTMYNDGMGEGDNSQRILFAPLQDGVFRFTNAVPGNEYVFMAYESLEEFFPEDLRWAYEWTWQAVFRHFRGGITVAPEGNEIDITFAPLANLTVKTSPEPNLFMYVNDVKLGVTANPAQTTGLPGWPVMMPKYVYDQWKYDIKLPFSELKVPVNYAIRAAFVPEKVAGGQKFLPKVDQNIIVPAEGKTHVMFLKSRSKVSGLYVYSDGTMEYPTGGAIFMFPDGASPEDTSKLVQAFAKDGFYETYLNAGFYRGYAVPAMGVPTFLQLAVEADKDMTANIFVSDGPEISGSIVDGDGMPVFGARVAVMRKIAARSSLTDGQMFIPYPVLQNSNEVACGPDGRFAFRAEPNVDYYLQPIVEFGYNPGAPQKVGLNEANLEIENIVLNQGASISGKVAEAAFIEAMPMLSDFQSQFGTFGPVYAEATMGDSTNEYDFTLRGMSDQIPYTITFWPMDPEKSFRKFENVWVNTPNLPSPVTFSAGYTLKGRLLNAAGEPITAPNVRVMLQVAMPMQEMTGPMPMSNQKYKVMGNVVAGTTMPPMPDMTDDMLFANTQWFEAHTDVLGRYEFKAVPQFISGSVLTEDAVEFSGMEFARGKTEFAWEFSDTNPVMVKDLKLERAGTIVGRLIDSTGQPLAGIEVEAFSPGSWIPAMTDTEGNFAIRGLKPRPDYQLQVFEIPGMVPVFRSGVLVEMGKTTDVGTLSVAKATWINGRILGLNNIVSRVAQYGLVNNVDLNVIAFDSQTIIKDHELAGNTFIRHAIGTTEVWVDPYMPTQPEEAWFGMNIRPGAAQMAVVMVQEGPNNSETLVTWGWRPNVAIPGEEQLGTDSFELNVDLPSPTEFGTLIGTLTHALKPEVIFNPDMAKIALYPVDAEGVLKPVSFPTVLTSPVNGRFIARDVPVGRYRIKIITKDYGVIFPDKIYDITVANTLTSPMPADLKVGAGMRQIVGKVVVGDATDAPALADAKVVLIPNKLVTATNAEGEYSFYMPVGSFLLAQVEVSKPGYETTRVIDFTPAVATAGIKLPAGDTALVLPDIHVSNAVSQLEVYITDSAAKPVVGAEATMIVKNITGTVTETRVKLDNAGQPLTDNDGNYITEEVDVNTFVYVPAEVQITDESGRAVFASVPSGKDVSVRARAFYKEPKVVPVPADTTRVDITMTEAKPKVFYRGKMAKGTDGKYSLDANFDFNKPVEVGLLHYFFGSDAEENLDSTDFTYPDKIGSKIMTMGFKRVGIDEPAGDNKSLLARMFYNGVADTDKIGEFNVFEGIMFRTVQPVDPTAEDGFNARQTDDEGNQLPAGITVPPGMLPPEVEQFTMTVEPQTDETIAIDGEIDTANPPKLAGPRFRFNFGTGAGESNAAAGTQQQGLFEITIEYDGSTNFEPRWYDEVNKRWSKIGILEESIKPNYPQDGYVTFKVTHLTEFAAVKNILDALIALKCDFNGDGEVDSSDLAYLLAYRTEYNIALLKKTEVDLLKVQARAEGILKDALGDDIKQLPSISDDLNQDGLIDSNDIALLIAWRTEQNIATLKKTSVDPEKVMERALGILPALTGQISDVLPKNPITR